MTDNARQAGLTKSEVLRIGEKSGLITWVSQCRDYFQFAEEVGECSSDRLLRFAELIAAQSADASNAVQPKGGDSLDPVCEGKFVGTEGRGSGINAQWPMPYIDGPKQFDAIKSDPSNLHSPWLLRMPGTSACLQFNHEPDDTVDEARCKWIAEVCNTAMLKDASNAAQSELIYVLRNEQNNLAASRAQCSKYEIARWDALQRVIDYISASNAAMGQYRTALLRVIDDVIRNAAPAPGQALTDEQIGEIAEQFWLKDAQKPGEFFDATPFARAVLAAPAAPASEPVMHQHKFTGELRSIDPMDSVSESWKPIAHAASHERGLTVAYFDAASVPVGTPVFAAPAPAAQAGEQWLAETVAAMFGSTVEHAQSGALKHEMDCLRERIASRQHQEKNDG